MNSRIKQLDAPGGRKLGLISSILIEVFAKYEKNHRNASISKKREKQSHDGLRDFYIIYLVFFIDVCEFYPILFPFWRLIETNTPKKSSALPNLSGTSRHISNVN
jgi:hypothetical protein